MYAIFASVTINDVDAATKTLREQIVPQVKQAPGFVAGYWTNEDGADGTVGRACMVFESEEAARAIADRIGGQPREEVTVLGIDVGEVIEHA